MSRRKRFEFDREAPALIASSVRDEILRKTQDDGVTPLTGAKLIARERIRPDPGQPRRHFDRAALLSLATSLLTDGMQAPITAYYDDDDDIFTILTGERRWRAAGIAELDRVPVLVQLRPADPADTLGKQLAENLLREDLTELEKAQALARLRALQPQTWQELARRHGLSDRRLYQMLSLIDAPAPLQIAIQDRQISGRHARALARLPEQQQIELLLRVVAEGISVRTTEELVRGLLPEHAESVGGNADGGSTILLASLPSATGELLDHKRPTPAPAEPGGAATSPTTPAGTALVPAPLGPTVGSVAALLEVPLPPAKQRQVRQLATRVEAMESQLRNVKVGELLPSVPELPEYLQRMRRLRGALDEYIGFLERVQLDAPGEMEQPI